MKRLVVQHPSLSPEAVDAFARLAGRPPDRRDPGCARWLRPAPAMPAAAVAALADTCGVDAALVDASLRLADFRLLAFDMDSTLITIECIDEIADYAGRKTEVAAITEASMRGELPDFAESLRRRVALLAGLPVDTLARVFDERLALSPGATALVAGAQAAGLRTLLVSGGFTYFTDRIRDWLALDHARANDLVVRDGRLTGELAGPIVDAEAKRAELERCCRLAGTTVAGAIAVGDGANDLKMLSAAGFSVAYRAKPVVRSRTTVALNHCGLDAILNFFDD